MTESLDGPKRDADKHGCNSVGLTHILMGIAEDVPRGNLEYLGSIPANGRILCLLLRSTYLAVKLREELVLQCLCNSGRHIAKISTSIHVTERLGDPKRDADKHGCNSVGLTHILMGIAEDVPRGNFKYLRSIPANGRTLCLLLRSTYLAVKLMEELVLQCLCDSRRHIVKISTSVRIFEDV
ncbi:hypothetical protein CDAR_592541 [Caerostris darwini]|uniref:Clp R domain-containing protein n=1 Tax=Caerostris darwini TaxID=1538125 RepID=A0AAV4X146_9ARAC|nr:hypothetical protein CDAR_592541 [Caerostris darwini]